MEAETEAGPERSARCRVRTILKFASMNADWHLIVSISVALLTVTGTVVLVSRAAAAATASSPHSLLSRLPTASRSSRRSRTMRRRIERGEHVTSRSHHENARKRVKYMASMTTEMLAEALDDAPGDLHHFISILLQYADNDARLERYLCRLIADCDDADAFFHTMKQVCL